MILFKTVEQITSFLKNKKNEGCNIGFVPTMGALHQGHISLVAASRLDNDLTICSIFVNPSQFNDPKDLEKYPVTTEKDIYMLEKAGCDVLFLPPVQEIYPVYPPEKKQYDLGYLETILEGKFRPGHFQGVCMVMDRLLHIIVTDNLYMGQKDYQQCMVIKRLIGLLNLDTTLIICPTLRENDKLAMSSRNMRLTAEERKQATAISEDLLLIKKNLQPGSLSNLKTKAATFLADKNFKIDYVEICDANDLSIVENWDGKTPLVALCAAFLNEVRLIDNMPLN
ncbi:pantoate--beta-alanine ligase [Ferruginibacter albus]|uniref:pantoate--beta-alanine ligase n=1 Tax=Ferruginibacter albus TaxID=2875540 RepID=UPI001CC5286C|nr:pantoate--beta-alanine ligase [Ferruginibacter albus]UAY51068.1 pantoate--beta-alanine ligase [Ferruginibacter albus]